MMFTYRAMRSDKPRDPGDDGDTMLLIIDLGFSMRTEQAVRLTGVTAPELRQPGGPQAAMQLRLICEDIEDRARARRLRWPFVVATDPNTLDEPEERRSFVRWLGAVRAFDNARTAEPSINIQMREFLNLHPEWGPGITLPDDG